MTAWTIVFDPAARKELNRLPARPKARVVAAVTRLAEDPYASPNVKALRGSKSFRLRVGDYRIVYRLENAQLIVLVLEVADRKESYRDL